MFSFEDPPAGAPPGDDSDDDSFESFVKPSGTKSVPRVPDYSQGFGSDDLNGSTRSAAPASQGTAAVDDVFAALGAGWSKLTEVTTQVAAQTKEKFVEGTQGLQQQDLGSKASSFISSLWSGQQGQVELYPRENRQQVEQVVTDQERMGHLQGGDDGGGWGAWDGDGDEDDAEAPAEDSWGAWGSSSSQQPAKKNPDAHLDDFAFDTKKKE